MDDLQRYIANRKDLYPEFAKTISEGYEQCKIGKLLRYARERAGFALQEVDGKFFLDLDGKRAETRCFRSFSCYSGSA